MLYFICMTE